MTQLIPNQPFDPLPEELYDELEAMDTYGIDEQVESLMSDTNLTVDEIEALPEGWFFRG